MWKCTCSQYDPAAGCGNAVNHGIRNIDWEGHIDLSVEKWNDHIEISVRDNGLGMTGEQIQRVLSKKSTAVQARVIPRELE